MRKKLPPIHDSAEELHQRLKSEYDVKKRQRLHAGYLAASGQVRPRKDVAALLGVHRHSVAAWFDAYAAGGVDQALHYQVSTPPVHRRITATALPALQEKLQDPTGVAGADQLRGWLADAQQGALSYASVHALVRDTLHAKPNRPRPSPVKQGRTL